MTEKQIAFLREPNFAVVSTVDEHGRPQSTVVWVDTDGESVLFNTTTYRAKRGHLSANPYAGIVPPRAPTGGQFEGPVETTERRGRAHRQLLRSTRARASGTPRTADRPRPSEQVELRLGSATTISGTTSRDARLRAAGDRAEGATSGRRGEPLPRACGALLSEHRLLVRRRSAGSAGADARRPSANWGVRASARIELAETLAGLTPNDQNPCFVSGGSEAVSRRGSSAGSNMARGGR